MVAIGCPGEGHNASFMQMRTQRANRFARTVIGGFCEALLPVPRRKVRAHVGRESNVFTHAEPIDADVRTHVVRPTQGHAQGETAGIVRTARSTGGCVTRKPPTLMRRRSVTPNRG